MGSKLWNLIKKILPRVNGVQIMELNQIKTPEGKQEPNPRTCTNKDS